MCYIFGWILEIVYLINYLFLVMLKLFEEDY